MNFHRGVKTAVRACCTILVLPLLLTELTARKLAKRDVFFASHSEYLSLFAGKIGSYTRVAYYRHALEACDSDCYIGFGTVFAHSQASVGRGVYIGLNCNLGMVRIGDNTMLADGVVVLSGRHQHSFKTADVPFQHQETQFSNVNIGANSWIGAASVVMADIGRQCVIGAGSIVTKSVADHCVAAGNPARVLRSTKPGLDAEIPTDVHPSA